MMYFEILHPIENMNKKVLLPGIYARDVVSVNGARMSVTATAQRIWLEQDGKVQYVKHRSYLGTKYPVDMKEFMWIKLTAKKI